MATRKYTPRLQNRVKTNRPRGQPDREEIENALKVLQPLHRRGMLESAGRRNT
jgi:hypothetical protein